MSEIKDTTAMNKVVATQNANRHLALYMKTRDGLLIWRAYQEFRKLGLDVPEEIHKKFDEFALALSEASGQKGIAEAMEMSKLGGGSVGGKRTTAKEAQRDVVEFMYNLKKYGKMKPEDINKAAAEEFDKSVSQIKKIYSEWMGQSKKNNDDFVYTDFMSKPWN